MALAIASAGCRRDDGAGVSDAAFVQTMAALEVVTSDTASDSAAKVAARRTILQEGGLTAERLQRKARSLAADPKHAAELWVRIDSMTSVLRERRDSASGRDRDGER